MLAARTYLPHKNIITTGSRHSPSATCYILNILIDCLLPTDALNVNFILLKMSKTVKY
jgi:hypothetical protein